ncbi:MAG: hypothetical protein WDZ37_05500 [Solirubrobacterales bacterium]
MPDFQRLKSDLGYFAATVAPDALTDWQLAALGLRTRVTVVVAGRQLGKSYSLAVLACWWAFRRPGQRVLVVSAGDAAARRLLAEVRRIATGSELLADSVTDELAGLLTLTTGSEVRSVPASEKQIRGWSADLLIADEASLIPDDLLLGAAFPVTAAREHARIVLASSATTASGAFYDHARRGEGGSEHVKTFVWVARAAGGPDDAPWLTPSAVEGARESMTDLRFGAEYLAEFASGADLLFSRAAIDRATADYLPLSLAELRGPARMLGGVDWGQVNDRSALVAVGRLAIPGERVFAVACAERWRAGEPLPDVVESIGSSPAHFDTLVAETNGLGGPCAQLLWRRMAEREPDAGGAEARRYVMIEERPWEPQLGARPWSRALPRGFATRKVGAHTTAPMKSAAFSALRLLLDQGRLLLPASAEELHRELLMLRVDLTPDGGEKIAASTGHDDLPMALALASVPYKPRGEWRNYLAELAEPRRPLPEPTLPPRVAELPTVQTPGGLTLPRRPVWVSVNGDELTTPPELDRPAPEPKHLKAARASVAVALATHDEGSNR